MSDAFSRTPSIPPGRLAQQLLDEGDREFLEDLKEAGRLAELDTQELLRIGSEGGAGADPDARRLDLLELYYAAGGEVEVAARRRLEDRFFVQRMGAPATAAGLVSRLSALAPEIGPAHLERYGSTDDGPLVLRAGEHFAAVLDDYEEETGTDEFDLAEAEARKAGVAMVTVRGLVKAVNVLLDKAGVRERLCAIRGDDEREVYLALGLTEAMGVAQKGYLEDATMDEVMDLGGW